MDKVKLGFIGTGGMASAHMRNIKENFDDAEFCAMCDISEDRAKQRAEEFGGNAYTDYRVMYDKEGLDAVYICTPPFAHGEQERIACEQGIAMFIEKPIHSELEPAIIINEDIQRSGVITSVGYHWRYGGNAQNAKAMLEAEPQILGALGYWIGGLPGTPWWRVRAQSGGQHVEQTTHIFDLARFLLGSDGKTVHGVAASGTLTDVENYDVDDISMVNIEFKNGTVANIVSCCAMQGFGRVQLEVFTRGLVVTVGGPNQVNRGGETEPLSNEDGQDRDRVFIDAVKTGDSSQILSTYSDALETLRIMLAASTSFRTGKAVDL
ncbi:MAG: Gfo/Idh/MocA family oxidoreductase [Candidatus Poribacteria bacterium]|nr:Gfo/Idh/MocA family oxidoreductase [Candidatus Poribacteria bacterium]